MEDLHAALKRYWGYDSFRPMQERIILSLLGGADVAVVMPTGGGKSLCYQLPALAMGQTVVVISPLIALMQDQVAQLADMGIPAALVNSSQGPDEQRKVMRAAAQGAFRLLYISPERLARQDTVAWLQQIPLAFFAIDEAHCISEWGHEFRPEYRQLSSLRANFPDKPIAAFTASATQRVRHDILQQLRLNQPHKYIASFHRANLRYVMHQCDKETHPKLLLAAMRAYEGESVIVYAPTIAAVEQTVDFLADRKIAAVPYHGQMENGSRRQPGTVDERRSPGDGGNHRVRVGDQQAGGAGGDPHVAAEIDRAVLPGGGPGRARRAAGGLRGAVAEQGRGFAGLLHRAIARCGGEAAELGAVPHGAAVCGELAMPAPANLHALRADAEVGALRDVRCLQHVFSGFVAVEALAVTRKRKPKAVETASPGDGQSADLPDGLLELFKEWRRNTSNQAAVPAYVVLSDAALGDLCRKAPANVSQLLGVTGIGERKAELYGSGIFAVFKQYPQPEALAAKHLPDVEVSPAEETLQLIGEGKTFEEIARIRGRQLATVVNMVADLIEKGRLEYRTEWVEARNYERIEEAVKRLGAQWLKPLREALPEEITWDQIRLVVALVRSKEPTVRADLDEHFLVLGGGVHAAFVLTAHQGGNRGGDAGGNAVDFADGAQDGAFHGAGDVFDLIDGGLHGVIDLLQTGTGAVARVVEKVAHAFDLLAPGTDDGDGFVRDVRDPGADILHDLVGSGGHLVDALDEHAGPFDDDDGLVDNGEESVDGGTEFCGRGIDGIEGRSDFLDHRTDLIEHWFHLGQHGFGVFHEPGGLALHLPGEAKQSEYDAGLHHEGQTGDQHRCRHHDPKGFFRHTR